MSSFGNYIFGWLVGYSGLLGPVAGIMVADYFLIRRDAAGCRTHCIDAAGRMSTRVGINPRAIVALVAGVVVALIGACCAGLCASFMIMRGLSGSSLLAASYYCLDAGICGSIAPAVVSLTMNSSLKERSTS